MVNDHGQIEKFDGEEMVGWASETLLRCAREAGEAGDFQEDF